MADSLSSTDAVKLQQLLAYMDAWDTAIRKYRAWYDAQWAWRIARYNRMLAQAEDEIAMLAVNMLPLDKTGAVDIRRVSSRIKVRKFLKKKDRILGRLIMRARLLFGARVVLDKDMHLFRGYMTPQLRIAAQAKMKEVLKDLQAEIEAINKEPVNA